MDAKPIYVISGKDSFLVAGACEDLLNKLLTPESRALALYQPQADKAEIADVLDELRTLPFLAERRVVLIKNADDFVSANRPILEKYFDSPCPTGVFILTVTSWPANTRLAKKLLQFGSLNSIAELKSWQLPAFAVTYARQKHNMSMPRPTAQLLVELVGDDPGRLTSEIDKLAMYVGDRKTIDTDAVEKLIGHNRMFNAFAVIDAMTAGQTDKAIGRLRSMFEADKSAEFTVVGAFAFHFRRMFAAKAMQQKGAGRTEIERHLNIWHNKDAFFRQLTDISLKKIGTVLSDLARIDHAAKTGSAAIKVAIEQLITTLAA